MNDKSIEKLRYDKRANQELAKTRDNNPSKSELYLEQPNLFYYKLLREIKAGSIVLELGAGMGENTEIMLGRGLKVVASDISPASVKVMKNRFSTYTDFSAEVVDMEKLLFEDNSFDVVCSAGSLSYGDNKIVMNEIYRVLKKDGSFIALDSLSNNPIYNINRYLHYLKGNRSKSTLKRIPNIKLIDEYSKKFGYIEIKFFGCITWMFPILKLIFSGNTIKNLSNRIDNLFQIKKSAFKFTMKVVKNKE